MAGSALNTFKSVVANVSTTATTLYTCPAETTTIVLLAQAANIHESLNANISFFTSKGGNTELVKNFTIPVGDAAGLLSGKLVMEPGESIGCLGSSNSALKITLSVLETT
jgi:hypothetical protein